MDNSQHPVYLAVMPLIEDVKKNAEQIARKNIEYIIAEFEAGGWDAKKVVPYPRAFSTSRSEYKIAIRKRSEFLSICTHVESSISMDRPEIVRKDDKKIEQFIDSARNSAAMAYEAYVNKLIAKVGSDVVEAALGGNHVWSFSVMTVKKSDGSTERWETKCIVNRSIYGLLFNQWPTRKLK
jgi:hypothetical protein